MNIPTMDPDALADLLASVTTSDHSTLISKFSSVMQCDASIAAFFLESCNWNVENAINALLSMAQDSSNIVTQQTVPQGDVVPDPEWTSRTVSVPAGSSHSVKVWCKNTGAVAWPSDTVLAFLDGTQNGPRSIGIALEPGQERMVDLPLNAGATAGETVASSWAVQSRLGYIGQPFWVILESAAAPAAPSFAAFPFHSASAPAMSAAPTSPPLLHGASSTLTDASMDLDSEDMELAAPAATPATAAAPVFAPASFSFAPSAFGGRGFGTAPTSSASVPGPAAPTTATTSWASSFGSMPSPSVPSSAPAWPTTSTTTSWPTSFGTPRTS